MAQRSWPRAEAVTTERLVLEPLRPEHAREMTSVLDEPEAFLAERYERQSRGASADGSRGWLNWVLRLRADGRAAGFVQATLEDHDGERSAELAWVVGERDRGNGFATEAATAAMGWLISAAGVTVLIAHIHPDNAASAVVASRLGLAPTPVTKHGEVRWEVRAAAPEDTG